MNPSNGAPDKVTFQVNVPEVMALTQACGHPVKSRFSGDQLMFTLVDGRKMYTEPYFQQRLDAAGVQPGMLIEVCKQETFSGNRRVVDFRVRTLNGANTRDVVPAPAPLPGASQTPQHTAPPPPSVPMNGAGETSSAIMARHYRDAIDVALDAVKYAEAKGLRITPCFEDVRAMAATLLINESGRR